MKAPFIRESFLLHNRRAVELFEEYARDLPILDYHTHLPVKEIAENRGFADLFELWLAGDHYKWRAMRTNGVAERFCTGDATPYEKFLAWAETVPHTLRNPLYHWTHLELKRYFGIDELLSPATAAQIWEKTKAQLQEPEFQVHGFLKKFRVLALCTTDDPADDLSWHQKLASSDCPAKIFPTFRPDAALAVDQPERFRSWLHRLEKTADLEIRHFPDLLSALKKRHDFFHQLGCRLSDHGLIQLPAEVGDEEEASRIFEHALTGHTISAEEKNKYVFHLMLFLGRLNAEKGWTLQLHLGAMRNNNTRRFRELGPDTGFDSIGDYPQAQALARYLDRLDQENSLPRTIIYNINPADNYVFGSMLGNFQDGSIAGKIQLGPAWWFLDQKEGMEWQINALSNLSLLSRFVGMVTDSRSFMSFPRHEYFRRVLCNLLGQEMETGDLPDDKELIGEMIKNICFYNAKNYLGLPLPE